MALLPYVASAEMDVILRQDIDKVGLRGDVVNVARGYARNFLLRAGSPRRRRRRRSPSSGSARSSAPATRRRASSRRARWRDTLNETVLRFEVKSGPTGALFGSVTPTDIVDEIWRDSKIRVDRRKIGIDNIKRIGRYTVPIELFNDVDVEVKTLVVPEGGELPPEEELAAMEAAERAKEEAAAAASTRSTRRRRSSSPRRRRGRGDAARRGRARRERGLPSGRARRGRARRGRAVRGRGARPSDTETESIATTRPQARTRLWIRARTFRTERVCFPQIRPVTLAAWPDFSLHIEGFAMSKTPLSTPTNASSGVVDSRPVAQVAQFSSAARSRRKISTPRSLSSGR